MNPSLQNLSYGQPTMFHIDKIPPWIFGPWGLFVLVVLFLLITTMQTYATYHATTQYKTYRADKDIRDEMAQLIEIERKKR